MAIIQVYWYSSSDDGKIWTSYGNFAPIMEDAITESYVLSFGDVLNSFHFEGSADNLYPLSFADIYTISKSSNLIKWSDIGNLDFSINVSNVAGERYMSWGGAVYAIKKLGKSLIVYGSNGISLMYPYETSWGLLDISPLGITSQQAVAGNDKIHFFITPDGSLWKLEKEPEKIGYQEYLNSMNSPVLTMDVEKQLLYICDGTLGYVYNILDNCLGSGPTTISGFGYSQGVSYFGGSSNIEIPSFELWTDIIDFGTREMKTLHSISFGINIEIDLQASLEFRRNKSLDFTRLPWQTVSPKGDTFILCHGQEFRVGMKTNSYESFEIDYIQIDGRLT